MFQTPFADRIRQEAGIPTIAVGAISEADHVNSIIAAGRADLCAVARPHLANPAWTLTEAAKIGYTGIAWPKPYRAGKAQMEALFEREKAQAALAAASAGQRASRYDTRDTSRALLDQADELGHEARAVRGDHAALKLWLRLLACTTQIEDADPPPAARALRHLAGALRLPGAAVPPPATG